MRRFAPVDWSKKLIGTGWILVDVLVLCARIFPSLSRCRLLARLASEASFRKCFEVAAKSEKLTRESLESTAPFSAI